MKYGPDGYGAMYGFIFLSTLEISYPSQLYLNILNSNILMPFSPAVYFFCVCRHVTCI
jgi:hypothetical protein